jgi:hypothetical protein
MKFHCCSSTLCGRPFQANRFDAQYANPAELGKIICPHCGALGYGDSDSIFLTHALSTEQECEFNARDPSATASA